MLEDLLALLMPTETALLPQLPEPVQPGDVDPVPVKDTRQRFASRFTIRVVFWWRELSLGYQVAGRYTSRTRAAYWDGMNTAGEPVASGLYFLHAYRRGFFSDAADGDFEVIEKAPFSIHKT